MPITIDDSQLLRALDQLMPFITDSAEIALQIEAFDAEEMMQGTTAHGDVTGATRESYRAFLIGGEHTGQAEAASGYAAAQAALASSSRGRGAALSQDSGIALGQDERGILYTSYTDYQTQLEVQGKAVLGPALQATQELATRRVAEVSRDRFK